MLFHHRPTPDGPIRLAARASRQGSGAPVLLVHGMAGDHRTWRSTARMLTAAGRPVLSVDLRGHGRSARTPGYLLDDFVDDLVFILDERGVDEVDVVGHSLGAQTSLRLAMREPGRVRRLVLEELPPMPRDQADLDEKIVVGAGFGEQMRGILAAIRDPRPLLRIDKVLPDAVGAQFTVADPQWWARLTDVEVPTLIISGGDRSFLPPRHLRAVVEALPDAQLLTIDTGHSVHRDKATEFNAAVADFLGIETGR